MPPLPPGGRGARLRPHLRSRRATLTHRSHPRDPAGTPPRGSMQDNRVAVDHTSRAAQVTPFPVTATSADGVELAGVHLSRGAPARGIGARRRACFHPPHPASDHPEAARGAGRRGTRRGPRHARSRPLRGPQHRRRPGAARSRRRRGLARAAGYERVATVGFSLGAAVALRQATSGPNRPDAVVAVSCARPLVLAGDRGDAPGALAARTAARQARRPAARGAPRRRVEGGAALAGRGRRRHRATPLLLVHFAGDRYFSAAHARALWRSRPAGRQSCGPSPATATGRAARDPALAGRVARWAVIRGRRTLTPVTNGQHRRRSTVGVLAPAERRAAGSEVG